ncbi:hypothetical protein OD91_1851 [Lutibacter sp. Hel_I_33_5]|uniref:hypothetical protein n=1 Tax=Lutibacter sp. Hel_I_33_5 TaxID=1566289 RepID=UPI0011A3D342|nr:hypothetical protein [Lutibacter sp. Hel_I_33_5]TVZ56562.1 hypothetical protein OD91_1851 [Lutibacter sp. Hel_I_33_5]
MKTKTFLFLSILGILFVSCKQEKPLQDFMINSWETTYLKIEMPTVNNTDSLSVYEDKFDANPQQIAQSNYNADGTFSAWFIKPDKVKFGESKGTWKTVNDSLFIEYVYGGREVKVSYHITKTPEGFLGKSKYDWDEDGAFDDLLIMKTKRIKNTN